MRRRSDTLKANLCQAEQRDLKTIAPLSHRPIVLTDTIDYPTIGFCTVVLTLAGARQASGRSSTKLIRLFIA